MTIEKAAEENTKDLRGQPTTHAKVSQNVSPLAHGDRLTRDEFERRYQAMPNLKKAELIDGVVYMPSPVRVIHGKPHALIMTWLGGYWAATPGVELMDNTTVRLDEGNEPQPDALLRIDEMRGGSSQVSDDNYLEGAPELIVEIAATSADYDLHEKLEVYRRNGVEEYIVWRTQEERLDWFRLADDDYAPLTPDANGVIQSQLFPGLCLVIDALLAGDLVKVLSELQSGLEAEAHAAFVNRLKT